MNLKLSNLIQVKFDRVAAWPGRLHYAGLVDSFSGIGTTMFLMLEIRECTLVRDSVKYF